ncbi:MAG: carbon starvation protein A [Thermoanaerobaculaceae bacterium]|nr:carbon starvation protein A [Thermoanaerobaculaceae bacterium]
MNAFPIMVGALCVLALGYRFYSAFIAAKALALDPARPMPAHLFRDGHNFVPMNRWVLFGHHFAAIAGAGPLVGPVLAMQFGYAPGLLWLLAGAVLAGCVHDFMILVASVRHNGRSLPEIARAEVSPVAGFTAGVAVLFIVVVALAGLGLVVVNALAESSWGTFTIAMTIPIAIVMGLFMFKIHPGSIKGPSLAGVSVLILAVVGGRWVAGSPIGSWFLFDHHELTVLLCLYGFAASVLPVWLLLAPRDYLSSYMKVGTVFLLIAGVLIVHPDLKFPAVTEFIHGGGPIVPGKLFPFLFVTIACGAISGFHSLVASGTTPKMLDKETDARMIGYGGMAMESLVGVVALIAAASLHPGDYYAINCSAETFAKLGIDPVNLAELSHRVGEDVAGRAGGAVSLAVGMAQIFSAIPGMAPLMSYWYHFAIMFEALFILTTIDAGTRVARFLLQEFLGNYYKPMGNPAWLPGSVLTTTVIVVSWGYFIYTGSIRTIWPMFGTANQLLATVALAVATTFLVNMGQVRYAPITALPMAFVAVTTLTAGFLNITTNFLPLAHTPGNAFRGYLQAVLTVIMMVAVVVILVDSTRRCLATLRGAPLPPKAFGPPKVPEGVPQRCC